MAVRPGAAALVAALVANAAACGAGGTPQAPAGEQGANPAAAQGQGQAGVGQGEEVVPGDLVKMRVLADTTRIAPGHSMTIAAHFEIAPGWHIYWENPGESGLSTDVEIKAPEGFAVGPVRYPGPVRFESPGPVTSYGYAGQVMLSALVQAPATLAEVSYGLAVEASWLACRTACVRGRASADLTLPVAKEAEPAAASAVVAESDKALFAAHAARLPQPWSALSGAQHAWTEGADGDGTLLLSVPNATGLVFYPATDNQLTLVRQEAEAAKAGSQGALRLVYKKAPSGPASTSRAHGVLEVTRTDGTRFYEIDIPRPNAGAP